MHYAVDDDDALIARLSVGLWRPDTILQKPKIRIILQGYKS